MPPEIALRRWPDAWRERVPQAWRLPLVHLALAWAVLFTLTAGDWADMAHQWWDSSTYNHVLLIPAILLWLVKLRLPEVGKLSPQAWWPGLVLLAGALLVWLLGEVSGLNVASQLGAVLAMQAAVAAVLGPRVVAALLFPLAYMLFLVPIGDELIPTLQLVTARLTIMLTNWSGIPAHIEGVFISTPAGLFEVAEACSGVKFLIAMIALGTLVVHLCFRSPLRRAAFMAAAVVLPVLANGVRAWGTIYIAQSQGVAFAQGFDHIFYGWVFFALVMAALLGVGWRFFDRAADEPAIDAGRVAASPFLARLAQARVASPLALGGLAVLALAFGLWADAVRGLEAPLPAAVALPAVPGWQQVPYRPEVWWEPRAEGAEVRRMARYRDAGGREVDVFLALYSAQTRGSEAGAFGEGALMPETAWRWLEPEASLAGGSGEWLQADGHVRRLAMTWYARGHLVTGSASRLKIAAMADRLIMRARPTVTLIVSAEDQPGRPARTSVARFLSATGAPGAWMDRIAQVP